jgi:hypothetical protein
MQNVVLSSISAAFDVHVTVKSSDSKPITGASVDFTAWGAQPGQTGSVGVPIGTATTDATGHATLAMPAIVQGYEVSGLGKIAGTTFVKIGARTAARTVSGTSYCEGDADEPVSCGAAGQACPVISVP